MTIRLYEKDAYQTGFSAKVLAAEADKGGFKITLDRTAFYPEGGGQPCDAGTLNESTVHHVIEKNGYIVHFCDRPLAEGETVHGCIDWTRRFWNMQKHSGEHILSGIVHGLYGYENVGFHIGSKAVTIDFDGKLDEAQLCKVEMLANQTVFSNVEIVSRVPPEETLLGIPYRSKKEIAGPVRIVWAGDADICACCGTHVRKTGEIGIIKIVSAMAYKGGTRLAVQMGWDAIRDYEEKVRLIRSVSQTLSAKPEEIALAAHGLRESLSSVRQENAVLKKKMFSLECLRIPENAACYARFYDALSMEDTRLFCDMLLEKACVAAVFSGCDRAGYCFVVESLTEDVRPLAEVFCEKLQAKGGGKPHAVQGTVSAERAQIEAVLREWKTVDIMIE